ncbi:MAG: LysR family transcriptional regulator [Pseudomonadota bacterium]
MATDRFQEIEAFVQIARSGSFSAAGRVLGLTPSAVSKLVTRLEKRFGARLFNRTTHAVRLSHEGEVLLKRAYRVIDAMAETDRLIDTFATVPSGQLRVYSLPSFALSQLAPIIPEFLMLYPQVSLDLQLGTENIDSIEAGVDVVLRFGYAADSTFVSRKIADSGWVVCAAPSYLAARGVPKAPEDLATHNCLNFSLRTRAIVWSFESHAIDACPATGNASTNQAPMLRELGLRGVGIIRVADFVASEDIRTGALVQLLPDFTHEPRQPIFAVYQRQPEQSLRIRTFVDFLHQKFSNSPWRMPRP